MCAARPAQCPDCESPRIIVVHEPLPQIERRVFLKQTLGAIAATAVDPETNPELVRIVEAGFLASLALGVVLVVIFLRRLLRENKTEDRR